ncbi:ATP-binding cassette subfamily G member 4-like isoform X2 [Schistocerca piceifrons]|uniref:ATP-binding cassette subfamily G member 4-like isoform X1 n=1 Tax=Schistocerca piceifrons TaxID=274613 RepID=UPI001F5E8120|nr:ATP-binding cassette subfamily G member 4-like isoform X1 [Schistocerca piceifrons]XP_047120004.1 ATP-binding cassette subfamily G member 4-like isoform X2 [Schistocerca piceifrons]
MDVRAGLECTVEAGAASTEAQCALDERTAVAMDVSQCTVAGTAIPPDSTARVIDGAVITDPSTGMLLPLSTTRTLSYLPERPPVDIEFQDLSYSVPTSRKGNKKILRSVSGLFRSGQLTGILGPSGAGKSTLLNILAGYRCSEVTGSILTNGSPRNLRQFRKMSRYIMQEDLVQPHLTVLEAMLIAADLKLGNHLTRSQKRTAVEEILDMLRLSGAKATRTLRLSGGERKRLSIALELINNPPVIFLDEPTTGLDDLSSSQCILLLKMLAQGGRTVICSVHTPSARLFELFDHVYVVAQGQCVYQGAGFDIVPFMASVGLNCPIHYNPSDFVIEVSSGEYGEQHIDKMVAAIDNGRCYKWKKLENGTQTVNNNDTEHSSTTPLQTSKNQYSFASSGWAQFRILTYRMLLQTWRNSTYLKIKIVMYLFVAAIISGLFYNFGKDGSKTIFNFGFCYTCIIVFLYIPMMPVLLDFPGEVQLLKREYFNRWYGLNAYFFALTVSKIPLQVALGLTYVWLVYVLTDQPLEVHRCAIFIIICLLIGFVSESFGLLVSSTLSIVNGMFVAPSMSVPFMLLAVHGLGTPNAHVPFFMKIAMYFSYLRYGLEGLTLAIYGFGRKRLHCPDHKTYCELSDPRELLRQTGMENANIWVDIAGLVAFIIIFRTACYFLLRWRLSSYKSFAALRLVKRFVKTHINFQYR